MAKYLRLLLLSSVMLIALVSHQGVEGKPFLLTLLSTTFNGGASRQGQSQSSASSGQFSGLLTRKIGLLTSLLQGGTAGGSLTGVFGLGLNKFGGASSSSTSTTTTSLPEFTPDVDTVYTPEVTESAVKVSTTTESFSGGSDVDSGTQSDKTKSESGSESESEQGYPQATVLPSVPITTKAPGAGYDYTSQSSSTNEEAAPRQSYKYPTPKSLPNGYDYNVPAADKEENEIPSSGYLPARRA